MWTKSTLPTLIETFDDLCIFYRFLYCSQLFEHNNKIKKKKKKISWVVSATFPPACNGGAQVARNTSKWKCEVKLAFAVSETSFHPVPTVVSTSHVGSLSVITQLFVFLRGTRFGAGLIGFQRATRPETIVSWHDVLFHLFSSVPGSSKLVGPPSLSRESAFSFCSPLSNFIVKILLKIRLAISEIRRNRMVRYHNRHSFNAGNSIFQILWEICNLFS